MGKKSRRKLVPLLLSATLLLGGNQVAFGENISQKDILKDAYKNVVVYAEKGNIPFGMTYEDFVKEYEAGGYNNAEEYSNKYYELLKPERENQVRGIRGNVSRSSSSGDGDWRYDIGTSLPAGANPVYYKYNLYNTVRKGDIIHESKGGFGITGHTAIVEGKFYDAGTGKYYIRIIEAIGPGVRRSCIDDVRVDDKSVELYRVTSASASDINAAVNFCIGEIGSSYFLDFAKDRSSSETDWYCSELVWAAFINRGINIEVSGFNEPGVTPRDIKNSSKTQRIYFK